MGLNPHAGDDGVIGKEEIEIYKPAIRTLRENGIDVSGPFASDGFFGAKLYKYYDGILASYHDQGLIPVKLSQVWIMALIFLQEVQLLELRQTTELLMI